MGCESSKSKHAEKKRKLYLLKNFKLDINSIA